MLKVEAFFALIVMVISANTKQLSNLGPNLLRNHNFSTPNILPLGVSYFLFSSSILGWNCSSTCEVVDCRRINLEVLGWNSFSGNCPSQALDVSSSSIEVISQIFNTQQGKHILDIKFIGPVTFSNQKILVVLINEKIVYKFHPLFKDFESKKATMEIALNEGQNKISFTSEGKNDAQGFRIFDVKIRRKILPQVITVALMANYNAILTPFVAIPCSRVIFGELINSIISLDRMQLYYYHHRKYSHYYNIFLKGVMDLLNQKGIYAAYISRALFSSIGTSEESIFNSFDFKKGRKYKDGYDRAGFLQNGGFFFIVSYIPVAMILFFMFNALFRFTFTNKFSKFLRKYSFFSLIVLMLFEGNIEQFAFLLMDQFFDLFSACFAHKILNVVIVTIFYFALFCSTAFYLYCWHLHNTKMSYLTDNVSNKISGMMAYTFDRGLACLVLGSVHRLTLFCGKNQLLILAAVQIFLIAFKILSLLFSSYKRRIFGWISVIEGFLRICFQLSIFIYESRGDQNKFLNKEVHLRIIEIFLLIWALNFICTIIVVIVQNISKNNRKNLSISNQSFMPSFDRMKTEHKLTSFSKSNYKLNKQKEKTIKVNILGKKLNIRFQIASNQR